MRIGIDLDNTLACYDELFWRLGVERGLIPSDVPPTKEHVRNFLRGCGREGDWTRLQGEVYGPRMSDAVPFAGALDAVQALHRRRCWMCIVSHRTKTPVIGNDADLHRSAQDWLLAQRFLEPKVTGLGHEAVFLELTKTEKLTRIESLRLDWFIDDLPELLSAPEFPPGVRRMLFDPHRRSPELPSDIVVAHHWSEVAGLISGATAS